MNTADREPPTQLERELDLIDEYKDTPMSLSLKLNLDCLKRFAGIGIPQFGVSEEDPGLLDHTQEVGGGFIELGSTYGPTARSRLFIGPVLEQDEDDEIDREKYEAADMATKYNMTDGLHGEVYAGDELLEESRKMINDLNDLIDAEIVREESAQTILKGTYMDTVIYFQLRRTRIIDPHTQPKKYLYTIFSAHALGETFGEHELERLSPEDFTKAEQVGISPETLEKDGVTHDTLGEYLGIVNEINGISHHDGETTGNSERTANNTASKLKKMLGRITIRGNPKKRK